ncbi:MAG: AhpC/TSA family protein [Anaerolineales bacterium]|nr:AhpC/TSA family protein [Anaerolineales bacterium]
MQNLQHLKFNDPAPDHELLDTEGRLVKLSSLWKKQVLVLAFTRHFGCPQSKEMVDQLIGAQADFKAKDLALALVTQGTPEEAKVFCAQRAPGVICLSDAERKSYLAYKLERASVWQSILSLEALRSNKRLKREKGWVPELPPTGQDAMQMAGVFVIAPDGRIRLPYYYDTIADHPPVDLLLHGVMGADWKRSLDGTPV